MATSVPPLSGGGITAAMTISNVRDLDKIKADLELVTKRRTNSRKKLSEENGKLNPRDFNTLVESIASDGRLADGYLEELWDALVWQDPSRLESDDGRRRESRKSGS